MEKAIIWLISEGWVYPVINLGLGYGFGHHSTPPPRPARPLVWTDLVVLQRAIIFNEAFLRGVTQRLCRLIKLQPCRNVIPAVFFLVPIHQSSKVKMSTAPGKISLKHGGGGVFVLLKILKWWINKHYKNEENWLICFFSSQEFAACVLGCICFCTEMNTGFFFFPKPLISDVFPKAHLLTSILLFLQPIYLTSSSSRMCDDESHQVFFTSHEPVTLCRKLQPRICTYCYQHLSVSVVPSHCHWSPVLVGRKSDMEESAVLSLENQQMIKMAEKASLTYSVESRHLFHS